MASSNDDVPIKDESPYPPDSIPQFTPQSPVLKRRRSEEPDEMGEKRQRVDAGATIPMTSDDDMAAIIAQAAADAVQHLNEEPAGGSPAHDEPSLFVSEHGNNEDTEENPVFISDPHLSMRILSLPILESLSTQLLSTLAQGPYEETVNIVTNAQSEFGQAYATLKSLFEQTKKIYSQQAIFLSADELNIREPTHRATILTTNLATLVASIFGGGDIGFYEINDRFIEAFTPEGEPLKEVPGQLFLDLKTQMYVAAVSQEEQDRAIEDILEDLFPLDFQERLGGRHPATELSPSEVNFVEASKARREYLMSKSSNNDVVSIQTLSEEFPWESFLKSLSSHLSKTYGPLIAPYMKRHSLTAPSIPAPSMNHTESCGQPNGLINSGSTEDEFAAEAHLAAQATLQSLGYGQNQYQNQPQQNGGAHYNLQGQNGAFQSQYGSDSIPPSQSAPTQVLYEKARQAAVAKSNPGNTRRPGLPSQRRPWSTEEENALMAGLDHVKGPHWSQILQLYGPGGTISEILKERNQVQLKDKARNLKLFFLKSNIEVPYYLQCVTGELKTRAPSQAARREAEERHRQESEDAQARFNGVLTLAKGLSEPSQAGGQIENSPTHFTDGANQNFQESYNSSQEFQVVEPEEQQLQQQRQVTNPPAPQLTNEYEHLSQILRAATENETRQSLSGADSVAL